MSDTKHPPASDAGKPKTPNKVELLEARIDALEEIVGELTVLLQPGDKSAGSALIDPQEEQTPAAPIPFAIDGEYFKLSVGAIRYKGRRVSSADLAKDETLARQVQTEFPHLVVTA